MKSIGYIITVSVWLFNIGFADDIYQYKDKNGMWVFTNKAVKNGTKVDLPPLSIYASPMTKKDYNGNTGSYKNDGAKIKVYNSMPSNKTTYSGSNEKGRQQILNEELLHEKQALKDSEQALASAQHSKLPSEENNPKQYQARLQILQDSVREHQKNIAILSQQLGIGN